MAYQGKSYVEHTAIRVKDIQWHICFFHEVLGMPVKEIKGPADNPQQAWTTGGIQLISEPSYEGGEGRIGHLGIMTDDLEAALQEAYSRGVVQQPQGRNWFALPDGLVIELIQARIGAVSAVLAVNPKP